MVALCMQNSKNDNSVDLDTIEELVGETSCDQSAEFSIVNRTPIRLRFEKDDGSSYLIQKLIAQARTLRLVPLVGLMQVRFGARADDDNPFHADGCLRMRASTSGHRDPAVGVCR